MPPRPFWFGWRHSTDQGVAGPMLWVCFFLLFSFSCSLLCISVVVTRCFGCTYCPVVWLLFLRSWSCFFAWSLFFFSSFLSFVVLPQKLLDCPVCILHFAQLCSVFTFVPCDLIVCCYVYASCSCLLFHSASFQSNICTFVPLYCDGCVKFMLFEGDSRYMVDMFRVCHHLELSKKTNKKNQNQNSLKKQKQKPKTKNQKKTTKTIKKTQKKTKKKQKKNNLKTIPHTPAQSFTSSIICFPFS